MRPRTFCLKHRFGVDLALPWMIKACHDGAVVPGGLRSTNRTGGGSSANGSGDPGTLPRRDDGTQDPHYKRLDGPGASSSGKPSLGTGTVRSVATSPSTVTASSIYQQQLVASSTTIFGKCFPRTADPLETGGVWTRERIGLVCNRPIQHNARVRKHESLTGLVW